MTDNKQKNNSTTKEFVEIADIRDTVVILKDGSLRAVLEVNSMNFELKSVDEQTAVVRAFQNFINSVEFPLQIVISSRKLNIEPYIKSLDDVISEQQNELLKIQATEYARFVKGLTELANIMAKKFYVVVPFYAVEAPTSKKDILGTFKSMVVPDKFIRSLTDEELDKYKIQLNQRVSIVVEGIAGMGLEAKPLSREQLIDMYYQYYNPGHHL